VIEGIFFSIYFHSFSNLYILPFLFLYMDIDDIVDTFFIFIIFSLLLTLIAYVGMEVYKQNTYSIEVEGELTEIWIFPKYTEDVKRSDLNMYEVYVELNGSDVWLLQNPLECLDIEKGMYMEGERRWDAFDNRETLIVEVYGFE